MQTFLCHHVLLLPGSLQSDLSVLHDDHNWVAKYVSWPSCSHAFLICSKGSPAYCIVMSGGYRDDVDEGLEIDYTGEGGQTNGKHVG